jgi:hypothetical protein
MLRKLRVMFLAGCCALMSVNCATIVSGRNQTVPVITMPDGATVTVGTDQQKSPATFILDRRQEYYVVKVEKEGFKTVTITLKRGNNGWLWGNVLLGGIIGLVVDFSTGSAYKFTPTDINVQLVQDKLGAEAITNKDILFIKLAHQ